MSRQIGRLSLPGQTTLPKSHHGVNGYAGDPDGLMHKDANLNNSRTFVLPDPLGPINTLNFLKLILKSRKLLKFST